MMDYYCNLGRNLYLDKLEKLVDSVHLNQKTDHLQNKQTFTKFVTRLSPLSKF